MPLLTETEHNNNGHGTRASIVGTVTHKSGGIFCCQRTRFDLIWFNLIKINEAKFGIAPFVVLCSLCSPKVFFKSLTTGIMNSERMG